MVNISQDTVDSETAAEILGVALGTLGSWRHRGRGPKWHKITGKIRYFKTDLQDYINDQMNPAA